MSEATRATIYLKRKLYRALKLKAASTDHSISELVNDAVTLTLREDALDLQAYHERKNEPSRSYEDMIKELKRDKLI